MKKVILTLSVITLFTACKQKEKEPIKNNMLMVGPSLKVDSTYFALQEDDFTATLKKVKQKNITGRANGQTGWSRTGPLTFILTDLYNNQVEYINPSDSASTYTLTVNWVEGTTFDKIRPAIANKLKETFGYKVETTTQMEPKYILSIDDLSKLQSKGEEDFADEGTKYKSEYTENKFLNITINGSWKIYATLQRFAKELGKRTHTTVVVAQDYEPVPHYFELSINGEIEKIIGQLQQDYGLSVEEKSVPVDYQIISF